MRTAWSCNGDRDSDGDGDSHPQHPWARSTPAGGCHPPLSPQVLAWGLRGLRGGVRAPSLELQCGGQTLRTPPILNLPTNPNFPINAFLLPLVRMGSGSPPPMGAGAPG